MSAATIGAPYRAAISSINDTVNPFQTFAQLEGPVATVARQLLSRVVPNLRPASGAEKRPPKLHSPKHMGAAQDSHGIRVTHLVDKVRSTLHPHR